MLNVDIVCVNAFNNFKRETGCDFAVENFHHKTTTSATRQDYSGSENINSRMLDSSVQH